MGGGTTAAKKIAQARPGLASVPRCTAPGLALFCATWGLHVRVKQSAVVVQEDFTILGTGDVNTSCDWDRAAGCWCWSQPP